MYKFIATLAVLLVFAGSAEAQRLQPVGPWFLNSVVDSMTDEIVAVAVLREDNAPRSDASTIAIACSSGSGEVQVLWNAGDVISRSGSVAYRLDTEPAEEAVWGLVDPKTLAPDIRSGFVDRLVLADRIVLRTLNYAGVPKTTAFTLQRVGEALDRIKSICGLS